MRYPKKWIYALTEIEPLVEDLGFRLVEPPEKILSRLEEVNALRTLVPRREDAATEEKDLFLCNGCGRHFKIAPNIGNETRIKHFGCGGVYIRYSELRAK